MSKDQHSIHYFYFLTSTGMRNDYRSAPNLLFIFLQKQIRKKDDKDQILIQYFIFCESEFKER